MEDINVAELIVWLIVGALAGTLAARLVYRRKRGYGALTNTLIGMVGAVIGGFLFRLLDIDPWFPELVLTFDEIIRAFFGSLILLAIVSFIRR